MIDLNSSSFIIYGLIIASFRIYLELIKFDFSKLPMTSKLSNIYGSDRLSSFHRTGLIFCVGYILLFAPTYLLS